MNKIVFLFVISNAIYAQNNTFSSAEKLIYIASYNMSGIMNDFAQLTLETKKVKTKSSTLLHLKCKATSYKKWDNFLKIRNLHESYVNPKTITPYLYKKEIEENDFYKFVKYKYNHKTKAVNVFLRSKSRNFDSGYWDRNTEISIDPKTKDIVATLYYIRTLDMNKVTIGTTKNLPILFENKQSNLALTLLKKETINTAIGEKECYKLAINIDKKVSSRSKNNNVIWLTSDENKIPVYGKFKVALGSGELKIKSAIGLKH